MPRDVIFQEQGFYLAGPAQPCYDADVLLEDQTDTSLPHHVTRPMVPGERITVVSTHEGTQVYGYLPDGIRYQIFSGPRISPQTCFQP